MKARRPQMPFLSIPFIEEVKKTYQDLVTDVHPSGDSFFEQFGIGNAPANPDFPYERFCDYEELLKLLHSEDPDKYQLIHKGTPFYYMSWLAFDFRDFEKALFYIDAAISEDIRAHQHTANPDEWLQAPGSAILTFRDSQQQVAQRTIVEIKDCLLEQLDRFNSISGQNWTLEDFINRFVHCLLKDNTKRTIVTAFYVFLMEFKDRLTQLELRSAIGGSIAPFIGHLFRGALIFESLLKACYPDITKKIKKVTEKVKPETLGDILGSNEFEQDFSLRVSGIRSSSLEEILGGITDNTAETAFRTAGKLRNTTGHNLIWNDVFDCQENYQKLYHQIVNALLYLIVKKFV
jgi:hypothetical protein